MYFPQISNKRVPSSVQKKPKTSASQTETWFPPTRPIPHLYSVGAKTTSPPAAKPRRPPSATPSHPSTAALLHHARSRYPRRRCPPQPQPQRPPRLVVEAEAEPSVPEPVPPRRPVPHRCRSNFATLHRTGVVPATPSFTASDLLPLRRHTATAT